MEVPSRLPALLLGDLPDKRTARMRAAYSMGQEFRSAKQSAAATAQEETWKSWTKSAAAMLIVCLVVRSLPVYFGMSRGVRMTLSSTVEPRRALVLQVITVERHQAAAAIDKLRAEIKAQSYGTEMAQVMLPLCLAVSWREP